MQEQPRAPDRANFAPPPFVHLGGILEIFDSTSTLSRELQLCPWPLASYEAAVYSAGGDAFTLAKSFILAMEGVAQEWYTSLRPL